MLNKSKTTKKKSFHHWFQQFHGPPPESPQPGYYPRLHPSAARSVRRLESRKGRAPPRQASPDVQDDGRRISSPRGNQKKNGKQNTPHENQPRFWNPSRHTWKNHVTFHLPQRIWRKQISLQNKSSTVEFVLSSTILQYLQGGIPSKQLVMALCPNTSKHLIRKGPSHSHQVYHIHPPKFNSSPLKNDGWKINFLLGR